MTRVVHKLKNIQQIKNFVRFESKTYDVSSWWFLKAKIKMLRLLKEVDAGFPWDLRCVTPRYFPGNVKSPQTPLYQNITQEKMNPVEPQKWRPVEPLSAHQAHCTTQKNEIYMTTKQFGIRLQMHFSSMPLFGKQSLKQV